MEKLLRIYSGLKCAWSFGSRCLVVTLRSAFKKSDRSATNLYLHTGAIKILKNIKASYKMTRVENFKLEPGLPRIYMSNHLSLFDTPLFYATIDDCIRIVTKKELIKVPLVGKAILNSEHAIVDREAKGQNQDFFIDAKKKLADGIALWFFPEGKRSVTGELLPFRMGGFRLATEIGAQIIPVGIIGTDKILRADRIVPYRNQKLEIHLGQPIDTRGFDTPDGQKMLMEKIRKDILQLTTSSI